MALDQPSAEAANFFSAQMLVHVVRNLVFNGALDPEGTIANIRETLERAGSVLEPAHRPHLAELAQTFEQAVRDAERQRAQR